MLLKALLNRITSGTGGNYLHTLEGHLRFAKASYHKYPELATLVEKLLKDGLSVDNSESLSNQASREVHTSFPAIEAISRVGFQQSHREEVEALLMFHLDSAVWTIRDKAAKTLGPLMDDSMLIASIEERIRSRPLTNNAVHGRLLCMKSFYESHSLVNPGRQSLDGVAIQTDICHRPEIDSVAGTLPSYS